MPGSLGRRRPGDAAGKATVRNLADTIGSSTDRWHRGGSRRADPDDMASAIAVQGGHRLEAQYSCIYRLRIRFVRVAQDYPGRDRDRLLVARLTAVARRHACWGGLTEAQRASGGSELRQLADRPDLLAEVAGLALGAAEGKGEEHHVSAQAQAVAELCRLVGADEDLVQQWIGEGKRRAEAAQLPPFSRPGHAPRRE